ncbi:MAG TPA: hypothetical protein PKL15_04435 [Saprospiraceae bacterium]|nr:hypothetical protein [Saprospiraceae bacterium]HNM24650.1 hypothetical protein [Saprospiraceae bacterium]
MKNNLLVATVLTLALIAAATWYFNRPAPVAAEITLPAVEITAPEAMPQLALPEVTISARKQRRA